MLLGEVGVTDIFGLAPQGPAESLLPNSSGWLLVEDPGKAFWQRLHQREANLLIDVTARPAVIRPGYDFLAAEGFAPTDS